MDIENFIRKHCREAVLADGYQDHVAAAAAEEGLHAFKNRSHFGKQSAIGFSIKVARDWAKGNFGNRCKAVAK